MANTVNVQTILDGSKYLVVKVYLASDGSSGELTDQVIVDASSFNPTFLKSRIVNIHSNLSGFTAILEWDATTDVPICSLADYEAHYSRNEIKFYGGFPSNAGAGATGDILLTTSGFTAAGDVGTILITLVKK